MGFAISQDGSRLLLLEKGRPAALKGKWMGVGGHIEAGETPFEAMVREGKEEADLDVVSWERVGVVETTNGTIYMHAAFVDIDSATALTDEPIQCFSWKEIEQLPLSDSTMEIFPVVQSFARRALRSSVSCRP